MKKVIILLALVCALAVGAFAQTIAESFPFYQGIPPAPTEKIVAVTFQGGVLTVEKIAQTYCNPLWLIDCVVTSIPIKEIYEARDGKIALVRTIKGKIIPAQNVPEKIEWDNSDQ